MPKQAIPFEDFVNAAGNQHEAFVTALNGYLLENNCKYEIKEAKSGYMVSYTYKPDKKAIMNYIFRKSGLLMRVYATNISSYMEQLDNWPDKMKAEVEKASACKRMLSPDACSPTCSQGFDFIMDGKRQQKCRYSLQFLLTDESKPYLEKLVKSELTARENAL